MVVKIGIRTDVYAEVISGLNENDDVILGEIAGESPMSALLELLNNVSRLYTNGEEDTLVLDQISLTINAGEMVAIIGCIRLWKINANEHIRLPR